MIDAKSECLTGGGGEGHGSLGAAVAANVISPHTRPETLW